MPLTIIYPARAIVRLADSRPSFSHKIVRRVPFPTIYPVGNTGAFPEFGSALPDKLGFGWALPINRHWETELPVNRFWKPEFRARGIFRRDKLSKYRQIAYMVRLSAR